MAVRVIDVRERVMAHNDAIAAEVRRRLDDAGVPSLNLMSSPGAGKTLLLERTLADIASSLRIATIVGDVQTQNDADRLARHTSRLVQAVVTGGACHLDARQVSSALDALDLDDTDLVFVENVGNLVCPASWDLGQTANVVLFAVTEGEDKPLKYPKMFQRSRYAIITKTDLLPYLDFDVHRAIGYLRDVNPDIEILLTSARSGEGLDSWYEILRAHVRAATHVLSGTIG
ncbi:MAG TPA: hydrogenase nickel incorporation protein HypB [Gemmatimonadaceae bacterium]